MQITIVPNEKGTPQGKLADADIHFEEGLLAGLKLVGFAIWESHWGSNLRVTVPSREYERNGERRRYDLVRGDVAQLDALRDAILEAWHAYADDAPAPPAPQAVARQVWRAAQSAPPARPQARPQTRHVPGTPGRRTRPAPPQATGTDDDYPF
jgi:hypothetical protein